MLDAARRLIRPSARSDVPPFMVMDVMAAAARIEAAGGRVIHLEVGQPAAAAPTSAIAAAHAALASGRLRYTETLGIASLRARIARHYDETYGVAIDPARVVFGGFSAGGQVATSLLTRFDAGLYAPVDAADALATRPDALAAVYPVVSMDPAIAHAISREKLLRANPDAMREKLYSPERNARADQPPLWLLHAEDDASVPAANSLRLREATRAVGASCESHVFERGGHGFGLMKTAGLPVAIWPELLWAWLGSHGVV